MRTALLGLALLGCGEAPPIETDDPPASAPSVLKDCGTRRNCVCSQHDPSDPGRWIAPLRYEGDPDEALARLKATVLAMPRTAFVAEDGDWLHVTFTTRIFRWVDDVQFLLDRDAGVIHVRSDSRVGGGDLGLNRRRVEHIRATFPPTR